MCVGPLLCFLPFPLWYTESFWLSSVFFLYTLLLHSHVYRALCLFLFPFPILFLPPTVPILSLSLSSLPFLLSSSPSLRGFCLIIFACIYPSCVVPFTCISSPPFLLLFFNTVLMVILSSYSSLLYCSSCVSPIVYVFLLLSYITYITFSSLLSFPRIDFCYSLFSV